MKGNYPEENIQHTEHGESLKSRRQFLCVFFWAIPWCLNSDERELPRRKHTTQRTRRKFEIKKTVLACFLLGNSLLSKFRWKGITQKKTYNTQNTAKVWNQEDSSYPLETVLAFMNSMSVTFTKITSCLIMLHVSCAPPKQSRDLK